MAITPLAQRAQLLHLFVLGGNFVFHRQACRIEYTNVGADPVEDSRGFVRCETGEGSGCEIGQFAFFFSDAGFTAQEGLIGMTRGCDEFAYLSRSEP